MKYHLYPVLMVSVCLSLADAATAAEIHVATTGNDASDGTPAKPLKSISAAALKAMPGDTIAVHAGTYRERVNPPRGGTSETMRITYQAVPGETVTLTGSEPAKGWVKVSGDTWKLTLPNSTFGSFNPFAEKVHGDWFSPQGRVHHRGCVYLGKDWLTEAPNLDAVMKPAAQTPLWFAQVDGVGGDVPASPTTQNTVIYAQFPGVNPNEAAVEISVRPTVFTPEKTNIDYVTVRGFDLRNAATNWAAPTAGQVGLVTAYWCKGWIIENNEISNSRCCGIALGKYSDQWDGKRGNTEGYYLTIDDALKKDGWTKEKIGGHLVRNNHIHHCGQTGIVGSLGCAFSRIEGNEIHKINMQGIWGGAEMAGIKFHGALDAVITGNHIYRCGPAGGLWLDWMAQGTQVTNNLFHDNQGRDIFTEVDHGPFLIANNIMLSPTAHLANSQGGAYAHNLMVGNLQIVSDRRRTPFHKPHSTELIDMRDCPIGDARLYNNLLAGRANFSAFDQATLPVAAAGNVFTKGSLPSKFETEALLKPAFDPGIKLTRKTDGWYLEINTDPKWASEQKRRLVTTALLGKATIPNQEFTQPDGSPLTIDTDYFGNPRDAVNPFPGPFEATADGPREIKVWPPSAGKTPTLKK